MNKLSTDKLADRVRKILKENPEARNNNRIVQVKIWRDEMKSQDSLRGVEFLTAYIHGWVSSAEGIRRRIPEVKKKYPELAGRDTTKEEKEMKEDLGYPQTTQPQLFQYRTESCPKCGKECRGRACHDCQKYW